MAAKSAGLQQENAALRVRTEELASSAEALLAERSTLRLQVQHRSVAACSRHHVFTDRVRADLCLPR